jgi:Cu2+-exporting ATPase
VRIAPGDTLKAGSLNLGAALTLEATARVQDSLVAEIARLLEAGQQNRGRYVRLADRAARLYVPTVHGAALAVLTGGLVFGLSFETALTNAIALLIITCPCALGLAVPAVQIVATSRLFRAGVLVKSGDALERLAEIDTVVFDKTGTLTEGHAVLSNAGSVSSDDLALAASLARASRHPLSRAIAAAAGPGTVAPGVTETAGEGLEAVVGGRRIRLGRAAFAGQTGQPGDSSELWLAPEGSPAVRFCFTDAIRRDAAETVDDLKQLSLSVELLSGDREAVAASVAGQLGIKVWHAATDPARKVARLEDLRKHGHRTLMVGDGLNDAAALAQAHVSISPSTAVEASQSSADMILQGDTLKPVTEAIIVARLARKRVLENFAFSAAYNALAIPLAAFGLVTPLIAAVAMSASSLVVMLNALRLARKN